MRTRCLRRNQARNHFQSHGGDYLGQCGSLASRSCTSQSPNSRVIEEGTSAAAASQEASVEAFPNPFSESTRIQYTAVEDEQIEITVLSLAGIQVANLGEHSVNAGVPFRVKWVAEGITDGIYFVQIRNKQYTETRKLIIKP